jgi:hypothetical protein
LSVVAENLWGMLVYSVSNRLAWRVFRMIARCSTGDPAEWIGEALRQAEPARPVSDGHSG